MLASFSAAPALQAAMETAKIAFAPSSLYHSGQRQGQSAWKLLCLENGILLNLHILTNEKLENRPITKSNYHYCKKILSSRHHMNGAKKGTLGARV